MKNPVLVILVASLGAGSMSCSTSGDDGRGGGGTQAESSSQGGGASGGSPSASGGASSSKASSSKASGGSSGSAGSTVSSSGENRGGSSAGGGQTASGGKAGAGGNKVGGNTGATANGGQSTSTSVGTGGSSETGGVTAAGGRSSTGGGSTAPTTGGSSGGAGGGSASGGSTGTDTGPKAGAQSSPGCGKTPTMANGAGKIGSRNFMLRIPTGYDNKHPYPLVFAFHWQGGTMGDVDGGGSSGYTWSYYGLREKADNSTDHKMIFVAPDGNGGWPNSGGADLKFVDDLYKQITEDLCVDTTRVFSMGFSYGGGMTYEIACARAKTFRAAAVYAGAQLSGCDGGKDPIAYIGFHSVSDPKCGYSGGEGLRNTFVTNNGCTAQTPPKPSGATHICTKYTGCKAGYPVEWCAFDGAGHSPAPVDGQNNDSGGGDKTWTKAEAWNFFTQF